MFAGDFLGKGKSQILFYCANDGNIWLGAFDNNNKIKWSLVNNCKDFGNLTDKSIRIFTGDLRAAVRPSFYSIIPVTATGGTAPL